MAAPGSPAQTSSALVRLEIKIKGGQPKEVVRKQTKGHEVVEVDGFVFKRKRKSQAEGGAKAARLDDEKENAPDEAVLGLAREVLECVPDTCPTAIKLRLLTERLLQLEAGQAAPGADGGQVAGGVAQLSSLFSGLMAAKMQEVTASAATVAGAQEAGAGQPPCLAELCQTDVVRASLSRRLAALQEEEAFWTDMAKRYGSAAADDQGAAGELVEGEEAAAAGPAGVPAACAALAEAESTLRLRVGLQLESVSSLVGKVEELVGRAESACSALQADYHAEHFRAFPHINSPAWLVKTMSAAEPYLPAAMQL